MGLELTEIGIYSISRFNFFTLKRMKLLGLTFGLAQAKSTESGIERMVDARRYDQFEAMAKVFDG